MSSGMKNASISDGFELDPDTGRYVPVPINFAALFDDRPARQNSEWNTRKCNDMHSTQPAKFRKVETGVRKELFKYQKGNEKVRNVSTKDITRKPSGVRKSLIKCLPSKNHARKPLTKIASPTKSSHMVTLIEESEPEEQLIRKHGYSFKLQITPHLKHPANSTEIEVKTPDSLGSNADFLRFEQLCQSPMITNESPVSSVCNMIENKMLLNSERKNVNNRPLWQKEIILEIKRTIGVNQEIYKETSSKIKEIVDLQIKQEENLKKIVALVGNLEDDSRITSKSKSDEEKENSAIKRRSLRLQNKSPVTIKGQPAGSPVILKAGDLRKSTLTKSLVSKCQKYQIDSTRDRKGMEMYNATKNGCSALLTPKTFRGELAPLPQSSNWRNNLSLKVQEQCLLLQDTPVHK